MIMCCRNEAEHIRAVLESLLAQEDVEGGFEVIVADGISEDGTRQVVEGLAKNHGRIRMIDNPDRIAAAGLNSAIRASKGDIIIRVDAHTEYASDYACRCVQALKETKADNVGGPARTKADTHVQMAIAAAYHSPFAVGGALFHDPDYEGYVDTVTYGCWRKEAFERFGYFDEELVRNQDDEHNLRIIRGGGRIWQSPKIKSWYQPRRSPGALFKQYMQYGYWKVRVIQKHKLPASWRHLVPGGFVLTLGILALVAALCRLISPFWSWSSVPGGASVAALLVLVATYCVAALAASTVTAAKEGWSLLPALPLVFACYHFGYGYGFLRGIWDFMVRRKNPGHQFVQLTRTASKARHPGKAPVL